jgi:folate-binding protein YgfZ
MLRSDESDRARLALRGPDRVRFLHGMVTCDVEKLSAGQGSRAAMLSVKGRLLADLVIHAREDELFLSLDGALGDKVRALLDKHIVMDDVEVVDRGTELGEALFLGEDAPASLAAALGLPVSALAGLPPHAHLEASGALVARDPSLGGIGLRVFAPRETMAGLGGEPLSAEAREVLRVEAGTARYGPDLDEERLVVEANLEDAISFDKGCYLGQEVVVRATSRGRVNRKLVGLVLSGDELPPPRARLTSDGVAEAGLITSAVRSARLGGPIALAYVHRSVLDADALVSVEGTGQKARVVTLPFDEAAGARRP